MTRLTPKQIRICLKGIVNLKKECEDLLGIETDENERANLSHDIHNMNDIIVELSRVNRTFWV